MKFLIAFIRWRQKKLGHVGKSEKQVSRRNVIYSKKGVLSHLTLLEEKIEGEGD